MYVLLALVGLAIGSFIAALTYRLPRGITISKGRSACPKCKSEIVWYDNIPLVSYIVLGGKCRNCKRSISKRYFFIELAMAIFFVVFGHLAQLGSLRGLAFGDGSAIHILIYLMFVLSSMIAIFVVDAEHQLIPDNIVFSLFLAAFFYQLLFTPGGLYVNLLSGFLGGLFLLSIVLFTKGKGMGLGDVKLAVAAGLVLGANTISWLFLSFIVGAVVGVLLIALGKANFGQKIAFGPFMIISFLIVVIFGGLPILLF